MKNALKKSDIQSLIIRALSEDVGDGDITSNAIFDEAEKSEAVILAKEKGIFCGGAIIKYIYEVIDPEIKIRLRVKDGDCLHPGDRAASLRGSTKNILLGERTVLNFIQRMCGIATRAHYLSSLLKGTNIKILDTRKTAPGFRLLDKYAVRTGGGMNHRMGLYDMIMIKDNHIKSAGSIREAVHRVRELYGNTYKVEVEATDLDEVKEALSSKADIIMLDNMNRTSIEKACQLIGNRAKIEVSGNIDEKKIKKIRDLKIDYISIGALTHSVRAFDLSMKFR